MNEASKKNYDEIRKLLVADFQRVKKENRRYSMRSYAKKHGVSQGEISEIMSGKRKPSNRFSYSFYKYLGKENAEYLVKAKEFQKEGATLRKKDRHLHLLEEHQFKMISEWQNYALFFLIETKDFQYDHKWISDRLGVSKEEVKAIIDRLLFIGLIKETDDGANLITTKVGLKTSDEIVSHAIRKAHVHDMEKARQVILSETPIERRDFTSCTYTVNVKNINKFKKLVRKFQDDVANLLEDSDASEVYRMSVYFYPLTEIRDRPF